MRDLGLWEKRLPEPMIIEGFSMVHSVSTKIFAASYDILHNLGAVNVSPGTKK